MRDESEEGSGYGTGNGIIDKCGSGCETGYGLRYLYECVYKNGSLEGDINGYEHSSGYGHRYYYGFGHGRGDGSGDVHGSGDELGY